MSYHKAIALFEEYSDRIVYGSEREDEALQSAVDWAFRERTDDFRADLYAKLKEAWGRCAIEARFVVSKRVIEEVLHG